MPFQRYDRLGKVHARRTPCPISLKYGEETSPNPLPHLAAFISLSIAEGSSRFW